MGFSQRALKGNIIFYLFCSLLFSLGPTGKRGVWGALVKGTGAKYAVVIGIGKYQDKRIPSLRYARADAQAIYDILTDQQYGGFPKENVRLLLDKEATEENIREAIGDWLSSRAKPEDMVVIYFAGHGARERANSFWVAYDANIRYVICYHLK